MTLNEAIEILDAVGMFTTEPAPVVRMFTTAPVTAVFALQQYSTAYDVLKQAAQRAEALEQLRPVWAQGHSSASVAAQCSAAALSEVWALLKVDNQTAAITKLRSLLDGDRG